MDGMIGYSRSGRLAGYDVVRIVLGLVLLTAAALKGYQLATEPVAETSLLTSRWFLIGAVEFELFFGLWLWRGLYPRWTWPAALLCFSGFGCIALYKALSGEASCGCFGNVPVNPWYTFVLDVAAVGSLFGWRPKRGTSGASEFFSRAPLSAAGVTAFWLALGIPAALAMASHSAAIVTASGDIVGDSDFVILEPEEWIGKRFPLLAYTDIGSELIQGDWVVILYHYDCPKCQKAIEKYDLLSRELAVRGERSRVALIELPVYAPAGDSSITRTSRFVFGRLDAAKEWFVETPLVLELSKGMVSNVSKG